MKPIWQNERKSMKLDWVTGVLNSFNEVWCHDMKAESPVRHSTCRNVNSIFLMIRCHKMWYARLKLDSWRRFRFLPYLMLHGCITYDINMTLLWWMDVAKSRYQFISSSWNFLSMVISWFISSTGNTGIWIQMSLKRILQGFWPQVQNTSFVEHLLMVAYNNISAEKQCRFSTNFNSLRKTWLRACLLPFWNTR